MTTTTTCVLFGKVKIFFFSLFLSTFIKQARKRDGTILVTHSLLFLRSLSCARVFYIIKKKKLPSKNKITDWVFSTRASFTHTQSKSIYILGLFLNNAAHPKTQTNWCLMPPKKKNVVLLLLSCVTPVSKIIKVQIYHRYALAKRILLIRNNNNIKKRWAK